VNWNINWDITCRLGLSLFLSGTIGLERAWRGKPVGVRTHVLVSLGSTLIVLISVHMASAAPNVDPTRIASNVVTGLGFLGAGTIMHSGESILGLTTAASLWAVGAIGLAVGSGYYEGAWQAWAFILVTLHVLDRIEKYLVRRVGPRAKAALKSMWRG
jgi:putative Mg2+ transporter-C (MgtC) family protein